MLLSEYQAKREALEHKMQEIGDREAELKKIATQIGNLKHKRAEINKQYEAEKNYTHRKYREEKHQVTEAIHALKMEYLTVNGQTAQKGGSE